MQRNKLNMIEADEELVLVGHNKKRVSWSCCWRQEGSEMLQQLFMKVQIFHSTTCRFFVLYSTFRFAKYIVFVSQSTDFASHKVHILHFVTDFSYYRVQIFILFCFVLQSTILQSTISPWSPQVTVIWVWYWVIPWLGLGLVLEQQDHVIDLYIVGLNICFGIFVGLLPSFGLCILLMYLGVCTGTYSYGRCTVYLWLNRSWGLAGGCMWCHHVIIIIIIIIIYNNF